MDPNLPSTRGRKRVDFIAWAYRHPRLADLLAVVASIALLVAVFLGGAWLLSHPVFLAIDAWIQLAWTAAVGIGLVVVLVLGFAAWVYGAVKRLWIAGRMGR